MPSQEELFDFFQKISIELNNNGYPILDNIIHPFPNIMWEEQIIKTMNDQKDYGSNDDYTDSSDEEKISN
tara:strand:- start:435 stop:644 length:210 start_codon:yes stop_codon:yes gene_type:complete